MFDVTLISGVSGLSFDLVNFRSLPIEAGDV